MPVPYSPMFRFHLSVLINIPRALSAVYAEEFVVPCIILMRGWYSTVFCLIVVYMCWFGLRKLISCVTKIYERHGRDMRSFLTWVLVFIGYFSMREIPPL